LRERVGEVERESTEASVSGESELKMSEHPVNAVEIDVGASMEANVRQGQPAKWRRQVASVFCQIRTLTLLLKHPLVPWPAKVVAGCAAAYLVSPIQLIPTFIPVIGQLDDLAVLYFGMKMVRKITPTRILAECEARAQSAIPYAIDDEEPPPAADLNHANRQSAPTPFLIYVPLPATETHGRPNIVGGTAIVQVSP